MIHAFLERRDAMLVASTTLAARSATMGNPSVNLEGAHDVYLKMATSFRRVVFPYMDIDQDRDIGSGGKEALLSAMFERLHEIKASMGKSDAISVSSVEEKTT